MTLISFEIPLSLPSVANMSEHWMVKAKRVKAQRQAVAWAVKSTSLLTSRAAWLEVLATLARGESLIVTLTRVAPRPIKDKHDNLRSAFKAIVDQVAAELGIDDSSDCIDWQYRQEKGPVAVRIEIARMEAR